MAASSGYCVVLNNQHQTRIDEFVNIAQSDPSRIVLFQPETGGRQRQIFDILQVESPIPLFLVVGKFGEKVSAVGLLHKLEYQDEISEERRAELCPSVSEHDSGLYALNILSASNVNSLKTPMTVSSFLKSKDETPLLPGQWIAVICKVPALVQAVEAM
jgi:hypothetical protein